MTGMLCKIYVAPGRPYFLHHVQCLSSVPDVVHQSGIMVLQPDAPRTVGPMTVCASPFQCILKHAKQALLLLFGCSQLRQNPKHDCLGAFLGPGDASSVVAAFRPWKH